VNLMLDRAPNPAPRPQRSPSERRISPKDVAAEPGQLDAPADLLAEHDISDVIELPGANGVFASGRQLHRASERQGQRLTPLLRHEVDLCSDVRIPELVARPVRADQRIVVHEPRFTRGGGREERPRVAIDVRHRAERAKQLRATAETYRERGGIERRVGGSLFEVQLGAIHAEGPTTLLDDLCGRDEPQSGIAPEGGDGWAHLLI
jgi:hypothetical protein